MTQVTSSKLVYIDPKELKSMPGNRLVDVRHIHSLMKAMATRNMLDLCPILVNKGKFIIDGQHRVMAAMSLGIKEIPCVIAEGATLADAQELNQRQKNWGPRDFAMSYAQLGNENYARFRTFLDDTGLRYTVALALVEGKTPNSSGRLMSFKTGQFIFTAEMKKAGMRRIEMLEDFKEHLPSGYNGRQFVNAFVMVEGNPEYSHAKMVAQLAKVGRKITKSGDTSMYVEQLERIYNSGEKDKVRFHKVGSYTRQE